MSARRAAPLTPRFDPDAPLCSSGKRAFRTEQAARTQLIRAQWVRRTDPGGGRRPGRVECGCYLCPACGWWHLTSASNRRTRRSDHAG